MEQEILTIQLLWNGGTPVNPNLTRVQTEGGLAQGIGMAPSMKILLIIKTENIRRFSYAVQRKNRKSNFYSLLQMYGSIIKNAELLDNNYKIEHLEYYMYGMNMLYAMMIKLFDYMKKEIKFDKLSDSDKKHIKIESEEEFEK